MSELCEGEDPFFSSIRALKAMIQPKSTQIDGLPLRSTNDGVVRTRNIALHDNTKITTQLQESSNIQTIRNVLLDLQSRLKEVEEVAAQELVLRVAVERERDEILSRWKAATENTSNYKTLEQDLLQARSALCIAEELAVEERSKILQSAEQEQLELRSSLKVAEESVKQEKSLRLVAEQYLIDIQSERKAEQRKFAMEAELRSNLEQERHDLQNKLKVALVTIDDVRSEKLAIEQQLKDIGRALEELENNLSHDKLMRLAAEQERNDLQEQLKSAMETSEQERRHLHSSLNDATKTISEEQTLRLAAEQERNEISREYEKVKKDLDDHLKNRSNMAQIETPVRNVQLVDDLSARLSAAVATAEKEKQQRLAVEQERDEVLLECREARRLFESPMDGDPYLLKKEAQRILATRIEERKKHLKEMDWIHLQLQRAISQRDSMEARLQGSKKVTDTLSNELEKAYSKIRELNGEDEAQNSHRGNMNDAASRKHGRSDNADPISVEDNETLLHDDIDQSCAHKYSKASD